MPRASDTPELAPDDALRRLAALVRDDPTAAPFAGTCLVGGAVRDALLGRAVEEADLAVPGDVEAFARLAAGALGTNVVAIGRDPWRLFRLPLAPGRQVDVVAMQGARDDDLARRDFTVNALAVPLADLPAGGLVALRRDAVVDPHGGLADLDGRVLRAVAPGAIDADPVRAMRGVRLACTLGFAIAPATVDAIRAAAPRLRDVAGERVGAELLRVFASDRAAHGVRLMDATGLLDVVFPSLVAGRDLDQRPVHRYPVLEHEIVAAEWMDVLLAAAAPADGNGDATERARAWHGFWDAGWPDTRWGPLRPHLARHRVALRIATLLHDAGKPATRSVAPDGRTRFLGHPEAGAAMAREDLARWRLPHALVERVALLIEQHLRPGQVASPGRAPTAKALHRFHQALGDATPDVCLLFLADSLSTVGADVLLLRWPAYVAHVRRVIEWRPPAPPDGRARLVDGRDVIGATGLAPGPAVGRVLDAVEEAAATGEVRTREEALALARALAAAEAGSSGGR